MWPIIIVAIVVIVGYFALKATIFKEKPVPPSPYQPGSGPTGGGSGGTNKSGGEDAQ